ncbi:glyoxylase-like metal-dependent hydrolase (beta-lactamase superfamily II) [Rhodopseudomonas faecalis]|uniref:Glyoxylase-like metal-dependent hydrolase (Beta-lactamase superfamily II) n=1 Tax=Rhodopseudomonas faecalis TaxID=99655 RepID=A0A318TC43_9BRAD|nr:MBL fold metallo-hydrolase [Rhodopseudomonas faecalis]PYF01370.1 glyoxylase-like metal-dependent hydrolase (beta-lactamase superfamily II) [Rhodopseudomonas faecalis]
MKWTVGKVTITRIVEITSTGGTRFILPQAGSEEIRALPWLVPVFATAEGRLKMTVHALVVETPTERIIVDTGVGNGKQDRNVPSWNELDGPFLDTLTEAGYPPERIDRVICTHLHVDHVGWNTRKVEHRWVPTFDNARYVFARGEFDYWAANSLSREQTAVWADSIAPVVTAGRADLVASDAQLSDEMTLIPTPGHTPGHVAVHIRSDGEEALLIGDVAHHPCQMAQPDWSSVVDYDPQQAAATRRELFARFADTATLVIGGHFEGGFVQRDGDGFRFVT